MQEERLHENTDFKFRDDMIKNKDSDTIPIEILVGPYAGVILSYKTVRVKEMEDGTARLQFDYVIHETKDFSEATLRSDRRFVTHAGLLLNYLILESLEAQDEALNNANREDNTEKFVEE